jgi:hypothetical protein
MAPGTAAPPGLSRFQCKTKNKGKEKSLPLFSKFKSKSGFYFATNQSQTGKRSAKQHHRHAAIGHRSQTLKSEDGSGFFKPGGRIARTERP